MTDAPAQGTVLDGPQVLRILSRRWWLLLLFALVGGAVGYVVATSGPEEFVARQSLVVTGQVLNPLVVSVTGGQDSVRVVETQIAVLQSDAVEAGARQRLDGTPNELAVRSSEDSNLVTAEVTARSPERAERDVEAYVAAYRELLQREGVTQVDSARQVLQSRVDRLDADAQKASPTRRSELNGLRERLEITLDQLDAARMLGGSEVQLVGTPSVSDVEPNLRGAVGTGAAVGLVLGALAALTLRRRRRPVAAGQPVAAH